MPPKKNSGKGLNTRSRSASRSRGKESDPAAPDASPSDLPDPKNHSPTREGKHPPEAEKHISDVNATVSNQQQDNQPVSTAHAFVHTMPVSSSENHPPNNEKLQVNGKEIGQTGHAAFQQVGDNREAAIQTDASSADTPALTQTAALATLTMELSAIRSRMDTLDKIELSISTLVNQFGGLVERTGKVESKVDSHSSQLTEVNAEIASLKETVEIQGKAIAKLTTMKADLLKQNKEVKADLVKQNKGITKEMNQLIDQQKNQVDSFLSTTKRIENSIYERVDQKVEVRVEEKVEEKVNQASQEASQEASFQSLKNKAFAKRRNLVLTGMKEDDSKTTSTLVKEFFKSMGADNLGIKEAYRIGQRQPDNSTYRRPILAEFNRLSDRNKVWRKRVRTPVVEGEQNARIQADLPKALRDEMNILYRVTRAAANFQDFKSAIVRSYAIQLNGREYNPTNLEQLPYPIRPSTISNPRSEAAIAFFSKYSPMSNHHPSPFNIQDQAFENMEHYLAVQRAKLSGQESTMSRASTATDPKQAKAILRSLRDDHTQEWSEKVEQVTTEGLRAKFSQNAHLLKFLVDTQDLLIGEASTDPRWGIGLDLSNPDVLDTSKWNSEGNLLGKCLMKIRNELSGQAF